MKRIMSYRWKGFFVLALLTVVLIIAMGCSKSLENSKAYPNEHLLATPQWLSEHLEDANLRIVDMRGPEKYNAGHIPGAVVLDGFKALVDPANPVAGMLLPAEEFAALMGQLGVGNDTIVVAYDDGNGLAAARLFYAIEYYGHLDKVKVLSGGFAAWETAGFSTSTETVQVQPAVFTATPQTERMATADYVLQKQGKFGVVILDTRSQGEYEGTDVRAARGGHIPTAVRVEWTDALAEGGGWKSQAELKALYEAAGITPDKEIIPYCQTNVRGAHTYFTLRLMGYKHVRPYEGSWAEWGNNSELPVEGPAGSDGGGPAAGGC